MVGDTAAHLRVRGHEFRCRDQVPLWLVAKATFFNDLGHGSVAQQYGAVYQLVTSIVVDEELERLDATLSSFLDLRSDELGTAIAEAMAEMRGSVPLERSADSSDGSTNPGTPTTSQDDSSSQVTDDEPTAAEPTPTRVVHLGRPRSSTG